MTNNFDSLRTLREIKAEESQQALNQIFLQTMQEKEFSGEYANLLPHEKEFWVKTWHHHLRDCNVFNDPDKADDFCIIHKPSDNVMRSFPLHFRSDRNIFERICPHGIGHPDFDDFLSRQDATNVHGCDGCCNESKVEL